MAEEPNLCKGCGAQRVDTGPPIWEDYCPNEECTYDKDEFFAGFRVHMQKQRALNRVKDAGPDLLAALQLHIEYEAIPSDRGGANGPKGRAWKEFVDARDKAIAKAMGTEQ